MKSPVVILVIGCLLKVATNTELSNAADDKNASSSGSGNGADHNKHGHGYQVFHFDFEEVKLPWIIFFWILLSSLAKIGKF